MRKIEFFDIDVLERYRFINDAIMQTKEKYNAHMYGHYMFDYPFIIEHLGGPPANIIDFGCGFGTLDFYLAEQGFEVWAIDQDDTRWFMERHPRIHFIHADLSGGLLRIDDNCWDYVIAASSIEHNEPIVMKKMVELAFRLLKPRGRFIATLVAHKTPGWEVQGKRVGCYCLNAQTIKEVFGLEVDFTDYDQLFEKFSTKFNYPYLPFGVVLDK